MGTRRLAGLVAVLASVVIGAPPAAADEVEFPPNTWVPYCDVSAFIDVNGSGIAIARGRTEYFALDLHAGTRSQLHDGVLPSALNDKGQVVGNLGNSTNSVGFVEDLNDGSFETVDPLGHVGALLGVNESGLAVGGYNSGDGIGTWTYDIVSGETRDLGTLGARGASAEDISDDGSIVGSLFGALADEPDSDGFILAPGAAEPDLLPGFNGDAARPAAISGDNVVGSSIDAEYNFMPKAWIRNIATGNTDDLGLPANTISDAFDVNDDGVVVGSMERPIPVDPSTRLSIVPINRNAFAYDASTRELVVLPPIAGHFSELLAIGDGGLAVGYTMTSADGGCPAVMQLRLPPHAPTSPGVELFGDDVSLSWTAPEFGGYDADLTYVVRFDGVEVARVGAPLTSVVLEATPCMGGTYTVTAENTEGASAPSEGAVLVARSCTPAAPAVPVPADPTFTG